MSSSLRFSAVVLVGLFAARTARAADYTWANAAGGNWNVGTNWSGGVVPGAVDTATIGPVAAAGVRLADEQSILDLTLTDANSRVVVSDGGRLNLGGTMTLSAGAFELAGTASAPAVLSGGTVTAGTSGTGRLRVTGVGGLTNVAVAAGVVQFGGPGASLRVEGTTTFAPGTVLDLSTQSDVSFFQTRTLDDITIRLTGITFLGVDGGNTLTLGTNATVIADDPNHGESGIISNRHQSSGANAMINRGTIRASRGELSIYRWQGEDVFTFTNHGLLEAVPGGLIRSVATDLTNAPGGVIRANGGSISLEGRWRNQGIIELNGGYLSLGGEFKTADMGTIVRTGGEFWLSGSAIDNTGENLALSASTGSYLVDARISGGSITAIDGAKLIVRNAIFVDASIGLGVLDFSQQREGMTFFSGTTRFAPGETLDLAGRDSYHWFVGTQQYDDFTVILRDSNTILGESDNSVTYGPTSTIRKTGNFTADIGWHVPPGSMSGGGLINHGLINVAEGILRTGSLSDQSNVSNRGVVQIDAGATWQGLLSTDGGTVQGGGTVVGNLTFTGTGNALRPGASPGTLTITGDLSLNSGTTVHIELDGTAPGTGHDQLAVTGTVTLANATLNAVLGGGYAPAAGDKLFILTNDRTDAIDGRFAGLDDGARVDLGAYFATISYAGDAASGDVFNGNDIVLYNFVPVPEPSAGLLLVAILAAIGCRGRLGRGDLTQSDPLIL